MKFKIKDLDKGKFKTKYLLLILMVIYLPIIINGLVLYNRAIDTEKQDRLMIVWHMMDKSIDNMNQEFRRINNGIRELIDHNGLKRGIQVYSVQSTINKDLISEFLNDKIERMTKDEELLKEIIIVSLDGQVFSGDSVYNINHSNLVDFIKKREKAENRGEIISISSNDETSFLENDEVVLFHNIKALNSEEVTGYFIGIVDLEKLLEKYSSLNPGYTVKTGFYNREINVSFGNEIKDISIEKIEKVINENKEYFKEIRRDFPKDKIIQAIKVKGAPIYYISVVNEDDLLNSIKKALQNNYLLLIHITLTSSFMLVVLFFAIANVHTEKSNAQYRYEISEEVNQKLRIYKHDFMNHLQIVQALIELDYTDKAVKYIQKLASEGNIGKCQCDVGIPEIESAIYNNLMSLDNRDYEIELSCINLSEGFNYDTYEVVNIISNLLKNAVQAVSDAVEEENKKIVFKIYKSSEYYFFDVRNSHPIIRDEIKEKIFEKGFTTSKESGRGLGLFITKKIVLKNKGEINLTVDENGNLFSVKLPL